MATLVKDSAANALKGLCNSDSVKLWWCKRVVEVLGPKEAMTLLADAFSLAIGPYCPNIADGSRKKDCGGCLFDLMHSSEYLRPSQHLRVFGNLKKYK